MDRVLFSKFRSIERCLARVREEYVGHEAEFETNFSRQDAAILNLIRACEQAIDMANRMIRLRRLEPPDDAGKAFLVLQRASLIDSDLAISMRRMVGFRNISVHAYEELDLRRVRAIIETRLGAVSAFSRAMIEADPTAEAAPNL